MNYIGLRAAIQAKKINQKEIAKALGMKQPAISRKLSEERGLTVDQFEVICNLLELDPSLFLSIKGPEKDMISFTKHLLDRIEKLKKLADSDIPPESIKEERRKNYMKFKDMLKL